MSLGSILKNVGKFALPAVGLAAAPFTGGASLLSMLGLSGGAASAIGAGASALAPVLGSASKDANNTNLINDKNKMDAWKSQEDASLNRDKFATTAPGTRLDTSYKASIMDRLKPSSIEWGGPGSGLKGQLPVFKGGLKEAMSDLSPETHSLSQQVMKDMLASQMEGGSTGGRKDSYMAPQPVMGKSSTGDKLLGGSALVTSILGALNKARVPGKPPSGSTPGEWG